MDAVMFQVWEVFVIAKVRYPHGYEALCVVFDEKGFYGTW